jgi:hypothetical protein
MLAAGRSDRCPAAVADCDAGPAIAMASGDTITTTITTAIPATVATTCSSTTPATSAATSSAAAFGQRGAYRQGRDCESEHEHSEYCHVAPPPETISITPG